MRRALITGITGQDGAYLARLLLDKGYEVHGLKRRASLLNTARLDPFYNLPEIYERRLKLHFGDMTDANSLIRALQLSKPDEIYNLAAQSHVAVSFEQPVYTCDVNALGTLRLLEGARSMGLDARIYQASSSEAYGNQLSPHNEATPHMPVSPYGVSKQFSYWIARCYRLAYGMRVSNGVLFNHESPLRGETFVTRKIVRGLKAIRAGSTRALTLGNLYSSRDWGHARDYVEGMWRILQTWPDDFVLATGETHSVKEFIERVAHELLMEIVWRGEGDTEVGLWKGREVIEVSSAYYRPAELDCLVGDARKAREILGWSPTVDFAALVKEMVDAEN